MVSQFLKEKYESGTRSEKLAAIAVSFWSRYLRNKQHVCYKDNGASHGAIRSFNLSVSAREDYSNSIVDKFEERLFASICEKINAGESKITLSVHYNPDLLLRDAAVYAFNDEDISPVLFSYLTGVIIDPAIRSVKYREGHITEHWLQKLTQLIDSDTPTKELI